MDGSVMCAPPEPGWEQRLRRTVCKNRAAAIRRGCYDLGVLGALSPKGFIGFLQRLQPGHADVFQQMRVIRESAQFPARALSFSQAAQFAPQKRKRNSPVFLMGL